MFNYFAYGQASWKPGKRVNIIAGARYTGNNLYGGKITPGTGITYMPVTWFTLKASVGQGFKSPTYAQMYQLFTNTVVGYTTVGANNIQEGIAALKAAGQVTSVWNNASQVTDLKAETSTSWNAGFSIRPVPKLEFTFNGFYNDLHNMIYNQQIGIKTNGGSLFSWFNIARAYTSGLEAGASWQPLRDLTISGGYQLLYARDRSYDDSIRLGVKTVRAVGGERKAVAGDHFGLPNRSRHMANLQLFYEYKPWGLHLSARGTYRSKYGFMDQNNNGFIDPYDVFVNGYVLLHFSARKSFYKEKLTLQLTIDNINDYTDRLMPAQAGRTIMAGIAWRCFNKKDKQDL
jgi:outer membrane receptor for ferrienterochelin and colicins